MTLCPFARVGRFSGSLNISSYDLYFNANYVKSDLDPAPALIVSPSSNALPFLVA